MERYGETIQNFTNILIKRKSWFGLLYGYIMIAFLFTGLLIGKPIKVFLLTLFFTTIGMSWRYIL